MAVSIGSRLGPCEILAAIRGGGMGDMELPRLVEFAPVEFGRDFVGEWEFTLSGTVNKAIHQ
jgi:hypothetical protein